MPDYRVSKLKYYDNRLYGPKTKRPILTVDKPFTAKNMPSGLELIEDVKKPRTRAAKKVEEKKTESPSAPPGASQVVENL